MSPRTLEAAIRDVFDTTPLRYLDGIGHGITELKLKAEKKRMAKRVIVDENVRWNMALWRKFRRVLGGEPWEYVFLSEARPGIPEVEILDKLLQPSTVLLTGASTVLLTENCVLHERAIQQGIRSYHVGSKRATDTTTTTTTQSDGVPE